MTKNLKKFGPAFLGLTLLFGWTGCMKTGATYSQNAVTYLSLINEATYTGTANVFLNDTLITSAQGIAAGTFSSQYGTVRPGNYAVTFVSGTTDSTLGEIPTSSFDSSDFYTLILYNPAGSPGTSQAFKVWDDFSTISTTAANYRFFNLCADYANVDLYMNNNLMQPGRATADNAANMSLNGFQSITAATYTLTAKVAGTDSVVATTTASLTQGNAFTIFLGGNKTSHYTPVQINVLQASY